MTKNFSSLLTKARQSDNLAQFKNNIKYDLPASIVVFFVALPLCLGIALASGAPLFSGIIAGVVGGIIVGTLSGSALGVSGPAAGLATIVFGYIATLGSFEIFLSVLVIAGFIQIAMGYLRLGSIAYYFPSSVIKGMLVGIGLLIIIKQLPYALGYKADLASATLANFLDSLPFGAIMVSALSITLLIWWEKSLSKKYRIFQAIPAPLAVVILGIILSALYSNGIDPSLVLDQGQLVNIPASKNFQEFLGNFQFPDFNQIKNPDIYIMALTLAVIASLETLLSTEACDKIDPQKRITPANRELKAQGVGNVICGLIGGLPVTQVIVRSSANVAFGARTKLSTILHGLILLIAAISIPKLLNMIPLASLACILLIIGYKLANPAIFKQIYRQGREQFLPFVVTIIGILVFDLLKGIALGMIIAAAFILINNFQNAYQRLTHKENKDNHYVFKLAEEVSFLNRGKILQMLSNIPEGAELVIDGRHTKFIHYDIIEILKDFKISAKSKNITLLFKGIDFRKFK